MSSIAGPPPSLKSDSTEVVLRKLEMTVKQKLDGLLFGNHIGLVPGPGSEAGESRLYHAGDDVRRMDWFVTARTTTPHIRETIADRELETWIVADLSASLDFGTADCEKRDLAVAAAAAFVYLTQHGGNRIGAIITTGEDTIRVPAVAGKAHGDWLIRKFIETPRAREGNRGDLGAALEELRRPQRRRGLLVVISDFLGASTWPRPLRGLQERHDIVGVEIVDPRELALPNIGLVTLRDPETGATLEVQTASSDTRERYAQEAQQQRAQIATALRRAGAGHLRLRTDRDWLLDVMRYVSNRRRGAAGGVLR
ncbi:uncharacterized protein DUF58 [Antricoccus suffuscus]|uniref:Uncharacterized protein DUF58 n=1 Tax=Antricoccus suffuscus TaxID=1629062 RepID=A0A2T1A5C1_9ACTN|nr:DUF58 domain-containing protein [Antricoccus suffuscus]PRZ43754.1 uncharacterized protein DUF58 [Antricoccus suffuscus]